MDKIDSIQQRNMILIIQILSVGAYDEGGTTPFDEHQGGRAIWVTLASRSRDPCHI